MQTWTLGLVGWVSLVASACGANDPLVSTRSSSLEADAPAFDAGSEETSVAERNVVTPVSWLFCGSWGGRNVRCAELDLPELVGLLELRRREPDASFLLGWSEADDSDAVSELPLVTLNCLDPSSEPPFLAEVESLVEEFSERAPLSAYRSVLASLCVGDR